LERPWLRDLWQDGKTVRNPPPPLHASAYRPSLFSPAYKLQIIFPSCHKPRKYKGSRGGKAVAWMASCGEIATRKRRELPQNANSALLPCAISFAHPLAKEMRDVKPEQMPAPSKRFLTLPPLPVACLFMATWESSLFTSQGGAGAVVESRSHKHRSDDRRCAQRRSAPRAHLMSRNATIAAPMIGATRGRRRTSDGCSSCRLPVGKDSHRIDAAA